MTVETEINVVSHTADGIQDTFGYPFLLLSSDHLQVIEDGLPSARPFTVTGVGEPQGGTVVFTSTVPADQVTVVLLRDVPYTQQIDYKPFDPFPAETHEAGLDKATMLAQQNRDSVVRSIRAPAQDGEIDMILEPASERALRFLAFDAEGRPVSTTGSEGPFELDDLVDVDLTNPAAGDSLTFDGAVWRNSPNPYDIAFLAGFDADITPEDILVQSYSTLIVAHAFTVFADIGNIVTPPVGTNVILDVLLNGATIYSSRPTFGDGTGTFTPGVPIGGGVAVAFGDILEFQVAQDGIASPGQGIRFSIAGRAI